MGERVLECARGSRAGNWEGDRRGEMVAKYLCFSQGHLFSKEVEEGHHGRIIAILLQERILLFFMVCRAIVRTT